MPRFANPLPINGISTSQRSVLGEFITVYPTLTRDFIHIEVENVHIPQYQIKVIDPQGKVLVHRPSLTQESIDIPVNGWTPGLYFLLVEAKGAVWVEGFVVGE